jgi:uncharacterized protein
MNIYDMDIELEEDDEIFLERDEPMFSFDRRTVDVDGRLRVTDCNISKANVCDYFGREVPGWEQLGLSADSIYRLYRTPAALKAAAASFEQVPLMLQHVAVSANDPQKMLIAGVVSNVRWRAPFLIADLCVWSEEAIRLIESGQQRELSSAYRYSVDATPGFSSDGEAYDLRMVSPLIGNHVALVAEGRAGSDVVVKDSAN